MNAQWLWADWLPTHIVPLRGWPWRVFILVWAILLCLVAFGGTMDVANQEAIQPSPPEAYGLEMNFVSDQSTLIQFPASEAAAQSGIKSGDRIEAINNSKVTFDRGTSAVLTELGLPATATFSVVTRDGSHHRYHLIKDPTRYAQSFHGSGISRSGQRLVSNGLYVVFSFMVPLALAVLLIVRRSRDPLAPWASMSMLLAALTIGTPSYWFGGRAGWEWIEYAALPLNCWFDFAVLALFPEGRFSPRWTWAIIIFAFPLAMYASLMYFSERYGIFNIASLVGESLAVAVTMARYRAMPPGIGRQQIRWALFGFAASLTAQAGGVAIFPLLSTPSPGLWLWSQICFALIVGISNVCTMVALTFGLLRYRLYDADATISRSVTYGTLTVGLVAIFAASEKTIELLGEEYFGAHLGALAGGLGAATAAVCVGPIHHRVTHWAEKRFRSALVQLRHGLPLLVGDMRETATPQALADMMLARVETGVRARQGAVIVAGDIVGVRDLEVSTVAGWLDQGKALAEDSRQSQCDRSDPVFPMRVPLHADGVGLVGWLLLGSRPDGSFYGREEREALHEIADPVARALAVAIVRERRETARNHEISSLREIVQRLQDRISLDHTDDAAA